MVEMDTDAARLALAAIGEADGARPLTDPYLEEQALRLVTFSDLDLATARRIVETVYHATTLSELMVRLSVVGAQSEISATLRHLGRTLRGL